MKKKSSSIELGPNTKVIHHGNSYAKETGTIMPPIFQSATFAHGNPLGFDYTRSGNPNFRILESVLSSIEGSEHSCIFASGVSSMTAIISSLKYGDNILCEENLYGCTIRLFEKVFKKFGIKTTFIDFTKESEIKKINEYKPAMIWIESPTNPLLKILDIKKICKKANNLNIPVVVDNTFTTSLIQKPLELGATLSLTSTTKFINGHSDALGGVVSTNDKKWHEKLIFAQKSLGLQPSPFDSWLITRGIKTLPLRLNHQVNNAYLIAKFLKEHPLIESIKYPFLETHPEYKIAKSQMKSGGSLISIKLNLSLKQTINFCKNLNLFTMAESLGGVESLICHPASMTHASVSQEMKNKIGISDSFLRLSIGCEDFVDLKNDLTYALGKLT